METRQARAAARGIGPTAPPALHEAAHHEHAGIVSAEAVILTDELVSKTHRRVLVCNMETRRTRLTLVPNKSHILEAGSRSVWD